jgi:hypothetical protein
MSLHRSWKRSAGLSLALGLSLVAPSAAPTEARSLPVHCGDLLDGDCDSPWLCIVLCYMELRELAEYCALYPTDPRCM